MSYRCKFKSGVVVFESPPPLREGEVVQVQPVNQSDTASSGSQSLPTWGEVLKDFIGKAPGLPPDMARNHDHYIHGTRKR